MRDILKNTRQVLTKKEFGQFRLLSAGGILISIADIAFLAGLIWIVRFYMQPGQTVLPSFLPGWIRDPHSVGMIGIFLLLFTVKNALAWWITRAQFRFTGRVAVRISRQQLAGFQQAGYPEFVETDSAALIRRIALQPFEFAQHILSGLQQIITQAVLVGLAIVAILLFNAKLFLLLLLILLPPVAGVFLYIRRRTGTIKKNIRESNEYSYRYLLDAVKGYVESNVNQRNDFFLDRFARERNRFSGSLFDSLLLQSLPGRIIELFAVTGLFILVLLAQWKAPGDTHTLITIGAFMAAAYKIIPGIVKLINLLGLARAFEFSDGELLSPALNTESHTKPPVKIQKLEFHQIVFRYPQQAILHNLSFTLQPGELAGISGISGKGKTTLLNLILGFLKAESGDIRINERSCDPARLRQYWPSVAYVRQQTFFIYDSILRNITLEDTVREKERLSFALEISGMNRVAVQFPEGLDMIITENGKNISGGQQQRIALARAFYKEADLYLLDEPFNELDDTSAEIITARLRQLAAAGKMILLVTHDRKILSQCDKIIALDDQA